MLTAFVTELTVHAYSILQLYGTTSSKTSLDKQLTTCMVIGLRTAPCCCYADVSICSLLVAINGTQKYHSQPHHPCLQLVA